MNKKSLGFTLIELLVVVAIISLLSSVILALVKDARQKAQIKAFRSEVQQLINALELYRADNGIYPGQDHPGGSAIYYKIASNGTVTSSGFASASTFPALLSPYIASIPKPKISGGTIINNALYYRPNGNQILTKYRCMGDVSVPPYVIYLRGDSTFSVPGFEDWPGAEFSSDNWVTSFITSTDSSCFSIK